VVAALSVVLLAPPMVVTALAPMVVLPPMLPASVVVPLSAPVVVLAPPTPVEAELVVTAAALVVVSVPLVTSLDAAPPLDAPEPEVVVLPIVVCRLRSSAEGPELAQAAATTATIVGTKTELARIGLPYLSGNSRMNSC
jgi:hypothetical protein